MILTDDTLKQTYLSWLRDQFKYETLDNNVIKIGTPFLDSSFDNIILYVEQLANEKILITDDGWTLDNLISEGLAFNKRSKTRLKLLDEIANSFGIEYDLKSKNIFIKTNIAQFAESKHRLLLALLRVNDLSIMNINNVKSAFVDDVADLLNENHILASKDISVIGANGLSFHYDFSIPGVNGQEKLVRTIASASNINQAKILNYDASFTTKIRKSASFIGIINDTINKPKLEQFKYVSSATDSDVQYLTFTSLKEDISPLKNVI